MSALVYVVFLLMLGAMLAIDLGLLNRKAHAVGVKEALKQAGMWCSVALAFNVGVYFLYEHNVGGLGQYSASALASDEEIAHAGEPETEPPSTDAAAPDPASPDHDPANTPDHAHAEPGKPHVQPGGKHLLPANGRDAALMFFQGYLIELMLSFDNMLVIAMIMRYFMVPAMYQHRVLFWGIIGAVVLRGIMIAAGSALVKEFHWVIYVFGLILIASAIKFLVMKEGEGDVGKNPVVRIARAVLPVTDTPDGGKFFTRRTGKLMFTPLFIALLTIEGADVIFAIDSIPAIFGITTDPFLVLSSNCFAILGLRAIYFAVAALAEKFKYLKFAMILVLVFIGLKMLLPAVGEYAWLKNSVGTWLPFLLDEHGHGRHIEPAHSLMVVGSMLLAGLVASLIWGKSGEHEARAATPGEGH